MAECEIDDILAEVSGGDATWMPIEAHSSELAGIPQKWRPIASAVASSERCHHALSLWSSDFMALLPGFARRFRDELADVRVFRRELGGSVENVLIYVAGQARDEFPALWLGWDPAVLGQPRAEFFDCFPDAVQTFLRDVHAGFTAQDWQSYGIRRPDAWESLDGYDWFPGESFDQVGSDPSQLMWFTKDSGQLYYCVNSSLPGTVTLAYEGNIDPPSEFAAELDELLMRRWDEQ
ncbi:hypothetical protein A5740_21770 [Mycobacterium sp. GA-1841]|uniref:hypothetical protein n=1 Tax=Mycobacterium sp. GA-1841 TaxID=1834154 RepID=UPI00096DCED3|nr:hypothetical protein [Mycobacterium sp. GA-1841]OMC41732.1 hypothetical protein A5740_21770 [Mycobacterium sp. GA-1841]